MAGYGAGSTGGYVVTQESEDDDARVRLLTPRECERLQGFPDDWTAGISDRQRYRALGNAVTVSVVRAIVAHLLLGRPYVSRPDQG